MPLLECPVVSTDDGVTVVQAPEVDPIDATGAGDAFAGALAWALHDGHSTVAAARAAVAASTVAVTGFGSQEAYPTLDRLTDVLDRVVEE